MWVCHRCGTRRPKTPLGSLGVPAKCPDCGARILTEEERSHVSNSPPLMFFVAVGLTLIGLLLVIAIGLGLLFWLSVS